ncbi:hypothetical protein X777_03665 [Ooceraea biroi]|uniref:Uncharacterized protein n=1 Tax=Ooceraea biroi TaxID=2015173 RepID=A0A026WIX9_OOCBI|nr:hypothetical protein X777_03665 [Ooceraea biroi]
MAFDDGPYSRPQLGTIHIVVLPTFQIVEEKRLVGWRRFACIDLNPVAIRLYCLENSKIGRTVRTARKGDGRNNDIQRRYLMKRFDGVNPTKIAISTSWISFVWRTSFARPAVFCRPLISCTAIPINKFISTIVTNKRNNTKDIWTEIFSRIQEAPSMLSKAPPLSGEKKRSSKFNSPVIIARTLMRPMCGLLNDLECGKITQKLAVKPISKQA